MLRCREIARLVSESMERDLPLIQRLQVRMHLLMCRLCAGFARQLRLFRRALQERPERLEPAAGLPEEARQRVLARLRGGDG